MFTRIMAIVMTVILLLTVVLSIIGWVSLRDQQISMTMEDLRREAREIAYLAGQKQTAASPYRYTGSVVDEGRYLTWKAQAVYRQYGAYILVIDRNGNVRDNMNVAYAGNSNFAHTLDAKEIVTGLQQVLKGEEIELHVNVEGDIFFTVGVPFKKNDTVLGAVFMQTPAQVVESVNTDLLAPVLGVAIITACAAALALFVLLRSIMRPLGRLTEAASDLAGGDFSVRVPVDGPRETAKLAAAFNTMADELSRTETSRKEFVANVSHELRSPITAIRGYVEGMLDGTIPPEQQARYLSIVSDESKRLSTLIGELLAMSRLEKEDVALNLANFDICDLLERVFLNRCGDLERKSLDVDCDFDPEPCQVYADAARIEQVVVNLIDNAIKFTPDGGQIRLIVRAEEGLCRVTVADDGVGILPEDRPRVFERFFTADRAHTSGKGTGLGLSICQRIMEMHGQKITLLDTEEGAAFAFTLELAKKA